MRQKDNVNPPCFAASGARSRHTGKARNNSAAPGSCSLEDYTPAAAMSGRKRGWQSETNLGKPLRWVRQG